jgi:hypothetical protein
MKGLMDLQFWEKLDQKAASKQGAWHFKPFIDLKIRVINLEVTWSASESPEALLMGIWEHIVTTCDLLHMFLPYKETGDGDGLPAALGRAYAVLE